MELKHLLYGIGAAGLLYLASRGCSVDEKGDVEFVRTAEAAFSPDMVHSGTIDVIIERTREQGDLYRRVVEDVVHTMRTNPGDYRRELMEITGSAFKAYPKEAAKLGGYVITKELIGN